MRIPKMVSCFGRVCAPWLIVFLSARITSKTRVTALARVEREAVQAAPRCGSAAGRSRAVNDLVTPGGPLCPGCGFGRFDVVTLEILGSTRSTRLGVVIAPREYAQYHGNGAPPQRECLDARDGVCNGLSCCSQLLVSDWKVESWTYSSAGTLLSRNHSHRLQDLCGSGPEYGHVPPEHGGARHHTEECAGRPRSRRGRYQDLLHWWNQGCFWGCGHRGDDPGSGRGRWMVSGTTAHAGKTVLCSRSCQRQNIICRRWRDRHEALPWWHHGVSGYRYSGWSVDCRSVAQPASWISLPCRGRYETLCHRWGEWAYGCRPEQRRSP